MSTSRTRTSRVFTISFPDALAREVEQVADRESRNISEIFRESFRLYKLQAIDRHVETSRRRALDNPSPGKEEDIEVYVDEIRHQRTGRKPSRASRP